MNIIKPWAWLACIAAASTAFGGEVVLEDSSLLAAFDTDSGALTRLESKATHWTIERRPELGVSFRLHAPLPHQRDNFVLGQKQRALSVAKVSDHEVRIEWGKLLSEHGGLLPMSFAATVTLENGSLSFAGRLKNDSNLWVETIDYPYLGDVTAPAPNAAMHSEHLWYGNLVSSEIYPQFANAKGYWGVQFPTQTIQSKQSLVCLIQSGHEGLYVAMGDPTQKYLLEYTFEQHPGLIDSVGSPVPRQDEISGLPVHLEFRTCHFIFAHPHSSVELAPVILSGYSGDWHAGIDIYKRWRATWFKPTHMPDWVKDVHSWLQLQINSPEEEFRVPYTQVAEYADECARNGVGAIQLVGWNIGGQDRGDPSQNTDPGLGTREELRQAIAQSQAKGVKIILFGKLNWADLTAPEYKRELYRYQATDPYGERYEQGGYSYVTPTQLAGINNRRRAVMDFLSPAYRDYATREFQKLLDLGAAGWLFDENCHHGPVLYNFAPGHGYEAPGYIYGGDMPMGAQLRAAADKVNPDFLFAGEGFQDWLKQQYACSYFRISGASTPVDRYIDSQWPLMVAVTGVDDREKLNLILLDRYIISYEPYNFKGHVTDFPLTLDYGKKIDALRRKYKAWIWDAEFRDTLGATVTADGAHRYSVFVAASGKRAVVVANMERARAITATVALPGAANFAVASPEDPESRPATGPVQIPARSVVVLLEQ